MRGWLEKDVLQKDFRMRAALSHSLSRGAGQYASLSNRAGPAVVDAGLLLRFAAVLFLSVQAKTFSKAASDGLVLWAARALLLGCCFDLSHEGSREETRCMMGFFQDHTTFARAGFSLFLPSSWIPGDEKDGRRRLARRERERNQTGEKGGCGYQRMTAEVGQKASSWSPHNPKTGKTRGGGREPGLERTGQKSDVGGEGLAATRRGWLSKNPTRIPALKNQRRPTRPRARPEQAPPRPFILRTLAGAGKALPRHQTRAICGRSFLFCWFRR